EQLGDAEVEQLHCAIRRHENVRWLEIPMHDQVLVCMRYRLAHDDEQLDTRREREPVSIAPGVDALAIDVLEHEKALAARGDAHVQQARDVGIAEPAEQPAFASETLVRMPVR